MSLAGNVKRSQFLGLLLIVVGVFIVLCGLGIRAWNNERAKARTAEAAEAAQAVQRAEAAARGQETRAQDLEARREAQPAAAQAERGAREAAIGGLRPVDRTLLDWQGRSIPGDKQKDVTKGKPFKINVYRDADSAVVNRAKVDLDRDDKWDEKWTFEPDGGVTRQRAPADDEKYSVQERWNGAAFVPEG